MSWLAAFAATLLAVGLIGLIEERVAVAPILARSQTGTGWVITTLAISLIISNLVGRFWGPDPILVKPPEPLSMEALDLGPSRVSSYEIALVVVTIILVAMVESAYRTLKGKAIMAVAEDREAALLRGIDPGSLGRWSFFLGAAFAAMTGVLAAPILYASTSLGPGLLLKGFGAAAVGSIGNNRGALVAGYLIGVTEAVGASLLSPGYQEAVIFIVVLTVLLLRPEGLFGSPNARTV
jgi:branched-chain amino acid transport system permease protein